MKKITNFILFFLIFTSSFANAQGTPKEINALNQGYIPRSGDLIPLDRATGLAAPNDYATFKAVMSDQIWKNIKSEGAICDGTTHPLSASSKSNPAVGYATLAAAQVDYPVAVGLGQEIDQVVVEQLLENQNPIYIPQGTCLFNFEIQISNKNQYIQSHPLGILKAVNFETGTAQAGTTTTITLKAASVGASTNFYNGMGIRIVAGTGSGQTREVSAYVTATKVATVSTAFSTAPDATSQYELYPLQIFQITDGTFTADGITTDGGNTAQNFLYMNGSTTEVESYIDDFYAHNYGSDTWRATNLVSPIWINGKTAKNYWDGIKCADIHSVKNGQFGDNIGAARCYTVTPSASSAKIDGKVYGFYFNAEGSDAEELDLYNVNVNAIFPSTWTMYNPTVIYTGDVRRLDKYHSIDATIINPNYRKSSAFVTAPSALATTDVGTKNLNAIDMSGSGYSHINIIGGTLDLSGFQNGYTSTAGCTDCSVRAEGTRFIGGLYDYNRFNPETEITGTATAGGAYTITFDYEISSTTDNYYNGNTIEITAGTGAGQTRTISTNTNTGTAQAGGSSTITLASGASAVNDFYIGHTVVTTSGTGSGQTRIVTAYDGTTKIATVDSAWSVNPDNTTGYAVRSYNGATRVVTVTTAWTTAPDATSVYHAYITQTGSPALMVTGTSDNGSGCSDCRFEKGVTALVLRGYDSFARGNYFYDPVKYAIYVNPSSGRTGCVVENNKVVTITSGRLNDSSGIIPVQVCDKVNISNNELIQRGNTAHRAQFITLRTAAVTGVAFNNKAPPTCDTCGTSPVDAVYKNAASLVRVHGDNGGGLTYEYRITTSANNITTGEDQLHAYALRPVAASEITSSIILEGEGSFANNANAKTLKVHYGTTAIISKALTASVAGVFKYRVEIFKTGTNTQRYNFELLSTGLTALVTEMGAGALTETEGNTLTVKSTGEGVATSDIVENTFSVRLDN